MAVEQLAVEQMPIEQMAIDKIKMRLKLESFFE
jgi:hypothetical protein